MMQNRHYLSLSGTVKQHVMHHYWGICYFSELRRSCVSRFAKEEQMLSKNFLESEWIWS